MIHINMENINYLLPNRSHIIVNINKKNGANLYQTFLNQ